MRTAGNGTQELQVTFIHILKYNSLTSSKRRSVHILNYTGEGEEKKGGKEGRKLLGRTGTGNLLCCSGLLFFDW